MTTITLDRPIVEAPAPTVTIPQWSKARVLAVWAAATLPMAVLAWVVAPALADHLDGPAPLPQALLLTLTAGLVWQFALVAGIVAAEQHSLRWAVVKDALWLHRPVSPRTGRAGGRTWLVLIPLTVLFGVEEMIPQLPHPLDRDMGAFMETHAAHALFHGSWSWFAVVVALALFNTVLGEELLFRGVLLPRMNRAFGRWDWAVNGALFGLYHLHVWWVIPSTVVDAVVLAGGSKRYHSAWIGIIVHSAQSIVIVLGVLTFVL